MKGKPHQKNLSQDQYNRNQEMEKDVNSTSMEKVTANKLSSPSTRE